MQRLSEMRFIMASTSGSEPNRITGSLTDAEKEKKVHILHENQDLPM